MLRTADLDYDLPERLLASAPVTPRDAARLMVVRRSVPDFLEHRHVRDLPEVLVGDELLVFNVSRVLPARLEGRRPDTGASCSGLFLAAHPPESGEARWATMIRTRRARPGAHITLHTPTGEPTPFTLVLLRPILTEPGAWIVGLTRGGAPLGADVDTLAILDQVGHTPLPPYILHARRARAESPDDRTDRERYQTIYAAKNEAGSVAAPTAGLHFTPELLARLRARGVAEAHVVLHVGTGTFRPVETEHIEAHPMHAEACALAPGTLEAVQRRAGRVIAVGTTSARTLESFARLRADQPDANLPDRLESALLITPGFRWRWCDGLLTNFHLPRSTLMAMVAARLDDPPGRGVQRLQALYREAIRREYRFYSFGDAMLILP